MSGVVDEGSSAFERASTQRATINLPPLHQRIAHYFWTFKTTPAGKCLAGGLIVTASFGSATLDIPLYHLVCVLSALFLVALVAGFWFRPRLELRGDLPELAVAGQTFTSQFHVTNRSRLAAYDLSVGLFPLPKGIEQDLQDGAVRRLGRNESTTISLTVKPLRRGVYRLPELYPYSVFPFGVLRSACRPLPSASLLIVPAYHPVLRVDFPIARRYQPGGIAYSSALGDSPEYIGSREYRPGDNVRDLDHRSWARLARPVVKEYQEEYFCRVALILDTYVPRRVRIPIEGHPELECAISLTAAVAEALGRDEHVIDIFAAGPKLHVFRAGRNTAHVDQVLEILAGVEPCRHDPCEELIPVVAQEMGSLSAAICIFIDWNDQRRAMVQEITESGCAVKLILVRATPPALSIGPEEELEYDVAMLTPEQVRAGVLEVV